jgi:ABC-type Zn2+ transport system substrate-binding protein/surface adhesin
VWNLGTEVWSTYEDPFPSPSYDEEDDHDHDHSHGHGHSHGEDEQDNVTMILPSAAKILAAQNK